MTDHLTPENVELVRRALGHCLGRTFNRYEVNKIIDAARAEGLLSPSGGGEGLDTVESPATAALAPNVTWLGRGDYEPTEAMIEAGEWHNHRHNGQDNMIASFKAMMQQAEIEGLIRFCDGGEAVHARPLSAASATSKDSLSGPTGEVGGVEPDDDWPRALARLRNTEPHPDQGIACVGTRDLEMALDRLQQFADVALGNAIEIARLRAASPPSREA